MLKKRLSLLVSVLLIFTLFPHAILAKDEVNMVAVYEKLGDIVTTGAGIRSTVNMQSQITTSAGMLVCISGGEFVLNTDEFLKQTRFEDGELVNAKCNTVGKSMYELIFNKPTTHSSLSFPIAFKANSCDVLLTVVSSPKGIFKEYSGILVGTFSSSTYKGEQTTTSGIIYSNTINDNNSLANNISNSYSYDSSSDSSPGKSVNKPSKDNVTNTIDTSTTYLSKEEVTAQTVKFTDIDQDSEEATLISKLAEKGIIVQEGEQFDIKKELTTDESLNYLARLLVVNDAAKSKLSDETVKKYLDPQNENFIYLATVGSILTEDTLKTVSEADRMSRELFAQVLSEVTALEVVDQEIPFTDIAESQYKEALEYCYNANILIGTSESTMSPSNTITNGQMLQVLSRLDEKLNVKEGA